MKEKVKKREKEKMKTKKKNNQKQRKNQSKKNRNKEEGEGEGEKDVEEQKEEVNEYLENIRKMPPIDPDGNQILEEDLIIKKSEIKYFLDNFFQKMFDWISEHKDKTFEEMKINNKELIDNSIVELDENLRKQWPRKGKLEVEVYQERKSQITAHNKKYERQIRQ